MSQKDSLSSFIAGGLVVLVLVLGYMLMTQRANSPTMVVNNPSSQVAVPQPPKTPEIKIDLSEVAKANQSLADAIVKMQSQNQPKEDSSKNEEIQRLNQIIQQQARQIEILSQKDYRPQVSSKTDPALTSNMLLLNQKVEDLNKQLIDLKNEHQRSLSENKQNMERILDELKKDRRVVVVNPTPTPQVTPKLVETTPHTVASPSAVSKLNPTMTTPVASPSVKAMPRPINSNYPDLKPRPEARIPAKQLDSLN